MLLFSQCYVESFFGGLELSKFKGYPGNQVTTPTCFDKCEMLHQLNIQDWDGVAMDELRTTFPFDSTAFILSKTTGLTWM